MLAKYECTKCEFTDELFVKLSNRDEQVCPDCGEPLKRIQEWGTKFELKGSNWFRDGYNGVGNQIKAQERAYDAQADRENKRNK